MALSDEVKAQVSLVETAGASVIWDLAKSNPKRGEYWAPCPLHGEATASFHITEPCGVGGKFYCFGCQASGSVIDFVMAHDGLEFGDAVKALACGANIDRQSAPDRVQKLRAEAEARQAIAAQEAERRALKNQKRALEIWKEAEPNHPDLAQYLEGRGIRLALLGGIPASLRWHNSLPDYDARGTLLHRGPAMIAAIGRACIVGIHRTWVSPENPSFGRALLATGTKVPKAMLGLTGQIFGAPVRLTAQQNETLIVGEGIETTLAGLCAWKIKRPNDAICAEAALTLGALAGPGFGRLEGRSKHTGKPLPSNIPDFETPRPGWLPPKTATRVIILADPSQKCPATARLTAERAQAKIAPHAPKGAALRVPQNNSNHGQDFADLAQIGALYET